MLEISQFLPPVPCPPLMPNLPDPNRWTIRTPGFIRNFWSEAKSFFNQNLFMFQLMHVVQCSVSKSFCQINWLKLSNKMHICQDFTTSLWCVKNFCKQLSVAKSPTNANGTRMSRNDTLGALWTTVMTPYKWMIMTKNGHFANVWQLYVNGHL